MLDRKARIAAAAKADAFRDLRDRNSRERIPVLRPNRVNRL